MAQAAQKRNLHLNSASAIDGERAENFGNSRINTYILYVDDNV